MQSRNQDFFGLNTMSELKETTIILIGFDYLINDPEKNRLRKFFELTGIGNVEFARFENYLFSFKFIARRS